MSERFNELEKNILCDQSRRIEYIIKSDIQSKLPKLNEEQQELFESIENTVGVRKEKKRQLFDSIKKMYSNFIELSYLNDVMVYDMYQNIYLLEKQIDTCLRGYNFFSEFLLDNLFINNDEKLNTFIKNYFNPENKVFQANLIPPKNSLYIVIDKDFINNERRRKIIFYEKDLDCQSVVIQVENFYNKIYEDIHYILSNKKNMNHLVLYFPQMRRFNNLTLCEEDFDYADWEFRINELIYCVNSYIHEHLLRNIYSISLIFSDLSQVNLSSSNIEILTKIISSNHISAVFLKNAIIEKENLNDLIKTVSLPKAFEAFVMTHDFLKLTNKLLEDAKYNNPNQYQSVLDKEFNSLKSNKKFKLLVNNESVSLN